MMWRNTIGLALAGLASLCGSGCTAKYQEKIGDLNERIAQFQSELTAKQAENRELMGKVRRLQNENDALVKASRAKRTVNAAVKPQAIGGGFWDPQAKRLTIPNKVTFTSGSYELSKDGKATLRKAAAFLNGKYKGHRFYVLGHTDNQPLNKTKGKYTSNRDLSARRAEAVALYLSRQGIARSSLAIVGYGDTKAVSSNKTDSGRARNRRVEITVGPIIK